MVPKENGFNQSENHKKRYFDWLTSGRPDRVKSSMFGCFVSANAAKLFF